MNWKPIKPRETFHGVTVGHRQLHFSKSVFELVKDWGRAFIEYDDKENGLRFTRSEQGHRITSHKTITAPALTRVMPLGRYPILEEKDGELICKK